jgi:deoxyribodipyrimidine photolyase-related protein
MSILVDNQNKPLGGQWSYDEDNRKKIPKDFDIPKIPNFQDDKKFKSLKLKINCLFDNHPGSTDYLWMPTNRKEALLWLEKFFDKKFLNFGNYEDAIRSDNNFLFHSAISPILNMGLLTPDEVVKKALEFAELNSIPINSLEGFIRQIIGWREFIRGVYKVKGSQERTTNFFNFKRKIPNSFYNATTGILPIDITIEKVKKTAYNHHIERLMVLGNFMMLCEFDPDEIYRWFMEHYIDAYDWVMVPNVYGMSQFADGGLMSTKPYISSSNYLKKMSDFPNGEWQKIWDALYWRFINLNREIFAKNIRMKFMVSMLDKMSEDKKTNHFKIANDYLDSLDK